MKWNGWAIRRTMEQIFHQMKFLIGCYNKRTVKYFLSSNENQATEIEKCFWNEDKGKVLWEKKTLYENNRWIKVLSLFFFFGCLIKLNWVHAKHWHSLFFSSNETSCLMSKLIPHNTICGNIRQSIYVKINPNHWINNQC